MSMNFFKVIFITRRYCIIRSAKEATASLLLPIKMARCQINVYTRIHTANGNPRKLSQRL